MSPPFELWVPGQAYPQGSKTFRGMSKAGRAILTESSKGVGPWRKTISEAAGEAMAGRSIVTRPAEVCVSLRFVMPRPKSAALKRYVPASKRPDVDKLARAVLDAITGACFEDDSQVTRLDASKRLSTGPGDDIGVQITMFAYYPTLCQVGEEAA